MTEKQFLINKSAQDSTQKKRQPKKRSWKFWLLFWAVAILMLASWAIFLQIHNYGYVGLIRIMRPVVQVVPTSDQHKKEIMTIFDLVPELTADNKEKTFLVLFQNNMEMRPGGGFIGSFGILKIKGEKVTFIDTHDTNIFDSRIESGVEPPKQMAKYLKIKDWEFRDSNWSPDFPTNAQKAEEFYHLQQGEEQFDGVVAISTDILKSFLEITGPITVADYPGEYNSENAIIKLEYQVEKGFIDQGIDRGERKFVMKDLAKAILERAQSLSWKEKKQLLAVVERHLNQKEIMVYFQDSNLEDKMIALGWGGEMKNTDSDYLMMVDANLAALKTDLSIRRSFEYRVDFSQAKPKALLKITYAHQAKEKDWMTTNYLSYLRVYVPDGSWLNETKNISEQDFSNEMGKKIFGMVVYVPVGETKTIELNYDLPESVTYDNYDLMVQKQSGIGIVPGKITLINKDGYKREYDLQLAGDWVLSQDQ